MSEKLEQLKKAREARADQVRIEQLKEDAAKGTRNGKVVVEYHQLSKFLNDYDALTNHLAGAVEAERERCAQVADSIAKKYAKAARGLPSGHYKVPFRLHRKAGAQEVANALRATDTPLNSIPEGK